MGMLVRFVVPFALATTMVAPAQAWERFISGGPNWVHNLARQGALSLDANGNVCLLSNDRVNGQVTDAHVLILGAQSGDVQPWQEIHSNGDLATFGVDCRNGSPVLGYTGTDPAAQQRSWLITGGGNGQPPMPLELPSIGAVHPTRFGVAGNGNTIVLRQRTGGSAYDLQAFNPPIPMPTWQATINEWRYPASAVRDLVVGADGTTSLIATFENQGDPSIGVYVQRYDATGAMLPSIDYPDPWFAEVGPTTLAPAGTAYFVRRNSQYMQDMLWRVGTQAPMPMLLDLGCCGPSQVKHLVALADDGVLVTVRSGYMGPGRLLRFGADGIRLWQADLPELGMPGFEVLGVIGDRAGRALVVSRSPWFGPLQATSTVTMRSYDVHGVPLLARDVPGVRFDEGNPLRMAVTSDDRVVVALNATDASQLTPGIRVQSFDLGSLTP